MKTKLILTTVMALLVAPAVGFSQYNASATTKVATNPVDFAVLPAAAQAAIQQHSRGHEIAKITAGTWYGQAGYRVEFREKGRNPDLYVTDSGTMIRPEEKPPRLLVGTTFDKLTPAAQATVMSQVANGEITNIDKEGGHNGSHYYKIDVMGADGIAYRLNVDEDGRVLADTRMR